MSIYFLYGCRGRIIYINIIFQSMTSLLLLLLFFKKKNYYYSKQGTSIFLEIDVPWDVGSLWKNLFQEKDG